MTYALDAPGSWLELRYARVGRSNQVFDGGPNTEIGGYGLTTLGIVRDFGSWQGALRLHNAFDEKGRVGAADHFLLSAEHVVTPRTLVVSAVVAF